MAGRDLPPEIPSRRVAPAKGVPETVATTKPQGLRPTHKCTGAQVRRAKIPAVKTRHLTRLQLQPTGRSCKAIGSGHSPPLPGRLVKRGLPPDKGEPAKMRSPESLETRFLVLSKIFFFSGKSGGSGLGRWGVERRKGRAAERHPGLVRRAGSRSGFLGMGEPALCVTACVGRALILSII